MQRSSRRSRSPRCRDRPRGTLACRHPAGPRRPPEIPRRSRLHRRLLLRRRLLARHRHHQLRLRSLQAWCTAPRCAPKRCSSRSSLRRPSDHRYSAAAPGHRTGRLQRPGPTPGKRSATRPWKDRRSAPAHFRGNPQRRRKSPESTLRRCTPRPAALRHNSPRREDCRRRLPRGGAAAGQEHERNERREGLHTVKTRAARRCRTTACASAEQWFRHANKLTG